MARKNLLKGLMEEAPETKSASPALPRTTSGAIGAVSKSIADLKTRAVVDLDPHVIDPGGLTDRLDEPDGDHDALVASIRDHGQQVPILVRPAPGDPDRYQVVYGRRRLAALRELGRPVKAMVRNLDDAELVMAQGQENTARRNLSFIEKAVFALQMYQAGYDRKAMCAALHIDKTVISRMMAVTDKIPMPVIEHIGAAHKSGRDRWLKLADRFAKGQLAQDIALAATSEGQDSDQRFDAVLNAGPTPALPAKKPVARETQIMTIDGAMGKASWSKGHLNLSLDQKLADGFDEWLIENIAEIHATWKARRE